MKVRRVCEECNTGWMHELEEVARPVLLPLMAGRRTALAPIEQEVIAVWAIKTALMCEFIHPRTRSASETHFRFLYERLEPTPNGHVWLAHYVGPKELDYNHRELFLTPEDSPGPSRKGYLTALIINRLVLYVLDSEGSVTTRTYLPKDVEGSLLQIQPIKWVYPRWPPEIAHSDESVEGFLHMLAPNKVRSSTKKG
jgi:hypothetical protein